MLTHSLQIFFTLPPSSSSLFPSLPPFLTLLPALTLFPFPPSLFSPCRDGIFAYFINMVQNKLHIVLCMSPVGDAFGSRCKMFPSLVNCCTIDWFTEWPREALLSVAETLFETVDLGKDSMKVRVFHY